MAYLGYMRQDKGFFFLLESLFSIPDAMAARMSVTIAAPIREAAPIERLRGLAHRFRAVRVFDGYTHATLDKVLEGVNLGLVPVLWEDNLPQVAIEMASACHGTEGCARITVSPGKSAATSSSSSGLE